LGRYDLIEPWLKHTEDISEAFIRENPFKIVGVRPCAFHVSAHLRIEARTARASRNYAQNHFFQVAKAANAM
jgi:hypothetical protein